MQLVTMDLLVCECDLIGLTIGAILITAFTLVQNHLPFTVLNIPSTLRPSCINWLYAAPLLTQNKMYHSPNVFLFCSILHIVLGARNKTRPDPYGTYDKT